MNNKFSAHLYKEVKKLFPDGSIETLIWSSSETESASYSAVKLIHTPTGHSVISDAFPTQTENCILGLIQLRILCDQYPQHPEFIG